MESLESLVGQEDVKSEVHRMLATAEANRVRVEAGRKPVNAMTHLVFTGPPGTGKTTAAKAIAGIYYGLGMVKSPKVTEVNARIDLTSKYANATPAKIEEVFKKAKGGVLFIDEAQGLLGTDQDMAGHEAVTALLTEVENSKADTVVILAGYTDQIEDLMNSDPGLRSRFPKTLTFSPIDQQGRADIVVSHFLSEDHAPANAATLRAVHAAVGETGSGNGRDAKNLAKDIIAAHSMRIAVEKLKGKDVSAITAGDVASGTLEYVRHAKVDAPIKGVLVPTGKTRKPRAKVS